MTDIQTEDNRQYDAHNRTHVKQTNELHSTNFEILTFIALRVGSRFLIKYHNFTYVSSEMYLLTKCGKSGIKAVYN